MDNKSSNLLDPIFEVSKHMIGLKLPSALPKDKIKEEKTGIGLSKSEIDEWKKIFANASVVKDKNDK